MRRTVMVLLTVLGLFATATPLSAQTSPSPNVDFQRVIVELVPGTASSRGLAEQTVARFGGRGGLVFEYAVQGFVAELPQQAIDALARNPNVRRITPDRIVVEITQQEPPTGYDRIEADLVPRDDVPLDPSDCPVGESCTDVDIAIIDTGTNPHEDLNVVARTDCTPIIVPGFGSCADGQGVDGHGHGTHVAGTAGAFDNGLGVVGISPGARIHSVKALGDDGTGFLGSLIGAVDWVTGRAGVIDVVNMSLAGEFTDQTFDTAIANSVAAGITYAVAAGNSASDAATFSPANHPDVITVSAVADADGAAGGLSAFRCRNDLVDDSLAWFTNFGAAVDIAAPGGCIRSTWNDGTYNTISGTSMASPHVAGAAALYVAIHGRDVNGDGAVDKADTDAVKAALITDGHTQGSACGFDPNSDGDGFPEPMLFVNGPEFGGDSTCEEEPVDVTPPLAPEPVTAFSDGFPVQLSWSEAVEPESGILHYRIYRDTVPSTGESLHATVDHLTTAFLDRDTSAGVTYTYQVDAVNLQLLESARTTSAQTTTASDDPTDAGWWEFEDATGAAASDSTAWQRPATLVNGAAWNADGRIGGALTFDGSDDRLDLDTSVLDGATDVTFATWIKTTKTGEQTLISGANAANDNEFAVHLVNDTTLRLYTGYTNNTGVEWDMPSIADGKWHHLTVIRNNTLDQAWAYRDGVSLGGWGLTVAMEPLEIDGLVAGQDQGSVMGGFSRGVDGELDDVRVYTRLLTQSEIDEISLRDVTAPSPPSSLTAIPVGPGIDLGWAPADDPESGIDEYQVWRDNGSGGTKTLLTTLAGVQTTYRDMIVRAGLTYTYEVVAINGSALSGTPSPEASATAGAADSDLIGWWALDDESGIDVADWSPAARNGALGGDPVWESGRYDGGLAFDGTDDLVDLDHTVLDGLDDFTVGLWFRTTNTGIQALVSGANAGNDAEYELVLLSNPDLRVRFYTGESNITYVWWPLPTAADGEWHHLAVVRDGTNDLGTLYFDGADQGTRTAVFEPLTIDPGGMILGQEQDVVGGGFDPAQAFVGTLDEVRVYDRLLTAAEVQDLAGLGEPIFDASPPAAPANPTATAGDGQVTLDWDDNTEPDFASYTVYRAEASGGAYTAIAGGLVTSGHVDTTVVNGSTYYYVVTAVDSSLNESDNSDEISAVPLAPSTFTWTDVTSSSGLAGPIDDSYVHAGAWGDVDGNGYPDLLVGTFVEGPTVVANQLLLNNAGAFTDSGQAPVEVAGRAAGALFADLDGDGDDDLLVSNNTKPSGTAAQTEPSHLYRNDGGVFTDVTVGSGLEAQAGLGRQAGVLDFDGDGLLDLFVVADSFAGGGPTVLLRNEGDLVFSDATTSAGLPSGVHGLGLAIGDVTGNGWPDIFLAGGDDLTSPNPNYLFVADGDGTYHQATSSALSWAPFTTGNEDWVSGGALADLNRDGLLDLVVGHHFGTASETGPGVPIRVYMNRGIDGSGDPIFDDITTDIGLPAIDSKAPHVDVQDFDNDGWPDLYVSVTVDTLDGPVPLVFRHSGSLVAGDPRFEIPTTTAPHYYPAGLAADFDRDGRIDVFLGEFRSVYQGTPQDEGVVPSRLLRNETLGGNWLDVEVDGPTSGIGASVSVYTAGMAGDPAGLMGHREIAVGYGFSSASPALAHLGLGTETAVDVVVTFPHGGETVTELDVAANQVLAVPEPAVPSDPGLVGWWGLDDGSGVVASDGSGFGNDGVLVGGPTWTAGRVGGGLELDGADDRVDVPAGTLGGASDVTFAGWVNTAKTGQQAIISGANAATDNRFLVFLPSSTRVQLFDGSVYSWDVPSLADDMWHHLAVTRNQTAGTVELFLDGQSRGSKTVSLSTLTIDPGGLVFGQEQDTVGGGFTTSQAFDGALDDLRLYTRILTPTEITNLANPTPPPADTTAPVGPVTLGATAVGLTVELVWDPAVDPESGISTYRIWRGLTSGSKTLLTEVSGTQTGFTDTATGPETTYFYEVTAVNGAALEGTPSPEASATTGIAPSDPGLVGWWGLDDGSGVVAVDSSGFGRDGVLVGGPVWTSGRIGGGVLLDGSDDRVDVPAETLDGASDVTFAGWVRTAKTGQQAIISGARSASSNNEFLVFLWNSTDLRLYTEGTYRNWAIPSIADSNWHHIAVTRDQTAGTVELFLDGTSRGTRTMPLSTLTIAPGGLMFGQEQDTVGGGFDTRQAFNGTLDDLRLYTRILTPTQITNLANPTPPPADTTAPVGPVTLGATAVGLTVELVWDPAVDPESGISTYRIWRGLTSGSKTLLTEVSGTQTGFTDTATGPETTYFYEVTAVNGAALEGTPSPEASATTGIAPSDPDLVGWWGLDDGSGVVAVDGSGFGRDGVLVGGPVWTSGRIGGGVLLDGSDDRVDVPAETLDGASDVTFAGWVNTAKTGQQAIISGARSASSNNEFLVFLWNSTDLRLYTEGTYRNWAIPSIADSNWHHIAVTRDQTAGTVELFLDGTSRGTRTMPLSTLTIAPGGLMFGQEQDTVGGGFDTRQAFNGTLDDLRLYTRILTPTQITNLADPVGG